MENSLSAPQYPQERAEHSRTKLQEKANKPRRNRVSLTRKAARLLGVKSRGFSPVRLAMMAVRLQAGETRSLNWRRKEKLQGELLLQLCSVKYASPFSPAQVSTISSSKKRCNSLKSLSREENRSMRQRRVVVCFFLLILKLSVFRLRSVAPTPGSLAKCVCEPEIHHNGGESGRRGNATVLPAPGSPDQWIRVFTMPSVTAGKRSTGKNGPARGVNTADSLRQAKCLCFLSTCLIIIVGYICALSRIVAVIQEMPGKVRVPSMQQLPSRPL